MTVFFLSHWLIHVWMKEWTAKSEERNNWMPEKNVDALTEEMCIMKSDSAHHMGVLYETINTKWL